MKWAVPRPIDATLRGKKSNAWAVIMAGGSGTRFWPESRKHLPKQFLNLLGPQTLLEQTFRRLLKVVPASRILVFTAREKARATAKLLGIPGTQVIGEPVGRNTAPCAAWAASYVLKKDPSAVLGIFPADHYIGDTKTFARVVRVAFEQAEEKGVPVTLGIQPVGAHTGYGYLERGDSAGTVRGTRVFSLKRFCEKPERAVAERYFRSGKFMWNAGIFVWRADCLLETTRRYLPAVFKAVVKITMDGLSPVAIGRLFKKVPHISIDYGLMEKLRGTILMIPVSMGWNDVGNWATLRDLLPRDGKGNVALGKTLLVESSGNVVKGRDRLIATVGLKDHVVVDSGDAILVCPMHATESIRKIVAVLNQKKLDRFL